MRILKSRIFAFILGAVIFGGIVGVSAYTIFANDIGYTPKDSTWKKSNGEDITNVKDAIDELYIKAGNKGSYTACMLLSGSKNTVSAKYHCDLGDGQLRNFYVLAVDGDDVKLIMEKNLTDEILVNSSKMLNWNSAITFFDKGNPGYTISQTWLKKVKKVGLPDAQDIANASNILNWNTSVSTETYLGGSTSQRSNYDWLYNNTKGCSSRGCSVTLPDSDGYPAGYWARNTNSNDNTRAFGVDCYGSINLLSILNITSRGVRPVITVSKTNLAG